MENYVLYYIQPHHVGGLLLKEPLSLWVFIIGGDTLYSYLGCAWLLLFVDLLYSDGRL